MPTQSAIDLGLNISRFDAHTRAQINAQLLILEKELKVKILDPDLTTWGRARVDKLLGECEAVIKSHYDDVAATVAAAVDGVAPLVALAVVAELTAQVTAALDVSLPTANVMKAIMGDAMTLGSPLNAWWSKQSNDTAFNFKAAVRQGLIQAETNHQIIKRVLPVMEVSRFNAATLVHTGIQSVSSTARMATYDENIDIIAGFEFLSALDSHTCIRCSSMSGSRVDASKKALNGKPYVQTPIHARCRCLWVANTMTYKELGINLPEAAAGTRASDQGQIRADITFDDFLKGKDTAYQDEMLGKGRAEMFRDGKITLADLTNGNTRPLTLEQLRAKYK